MQGELHRKNVMSFVLKQIVKKCFLEEKKKILVSLVYM